MTVIPGGLITLEYAAEGLSFRDVGTSSTSARDADLTTYVQAATSIIEDIVGPVLQVTKTLTFDGDCAAIVLPHRATAITSLTVAGTLASPSTYVFVPEASIIYSTTIFGGGQRDIEVVYVAGYNPVPITLQLAARELVRFWWQQGKASPQYDDQNAGSAVPQGFGTPKRVRDLCEPFVGGPEAGFA